VCPSLAEIVLLTVARGGNEARKIPSGQNLDVGLDLDCGDSSINLAYSR
jgi:hypothetical protein